MTDSASTVSFDINRGNTFTRRFPKFTQSISKIFEVDLKLKCNSRTFEVSRAPLIPNCTRGRAISNANITLALILQGYVAFGLLSDVNEHAAVHCIN